MLLIIHSLVFLCGGFWKLKEKCVRSKLSALKLIYRKIFRLYNILYGSGIAYNSTFSGKACFPHGINGVFVSGQAKIGKDCVIFQQVTIGSITVPTSSGFGAPRIGDNCYIGAGAKIIGNISIGNNVRVGANCVVYENIPDNSSVVPASCSIHPGISGMNNRYYTFNKKWLYFENGKFVEEKDPEILKKFKRNNS
jgi:serine O-acetyltransferase